MAYTLSSSQINNGEFWGKTSLWNYNFSETRRRITSVTTGLGTITFVLVNSTLNPKNPFAATTSTQTDLVKITNVAGLNGTYPVASVGTNSITIKASLNLINAGPFNTTLQSMATRVTKALANKTEPRTLGNFKWNRNLKGADAPVPMCDMQYQMYDILMQFWSDPEIIQEWKAKYQSNKSTWDTQRGPTSYFFGGKLFDLATMVKWWMCTIYSESTWKATSYGKLSPNQYLTKLETTGNYDSWPTSGIPCGLWQIGVRSGATWWKSSSETAAQFAAKKDWQDVSLAFNPEYNTRAALWIMFQLLFNTNTKPSMYWGSSDYYNIDNIKMKDCFDQNPTNYMQVGSSSIICEYFKK